jgi:hypothetical protein
LHRPNVITTNVKYFREDFHHVCLPLGPYSPFCVCGAAKWPYHFGHVFPAGWATRLDFFFVSLVVLSLWPWLRIFAHFCPSFICLHSLARLSAVYFWTLFIENIHLEFNI